MPIKFRNLFFPKIIVCLLLLTNISTNGQVDYFTTEINSSTFEQTIQNGRIAFINYDSDIKKIFSTVNYSNDFELPLHVSTENVPKKIIFEFAVTNKKNTTDSFYFFPGKFFTNVNLYQFDGLQLVSLPTIAPNHADSVSFRQFIIPSNDTLILVAEIFPLKSYTNFFNPTVIKSNYITAFIESLQTAKKGEKIVTYLFCGMLLMMIFYSLAALWRGGNKSFIYYSIYAFLLCFMLFTKHFYFGKSSATNFIFESYLDFLLQGASMCFYLIFINEFLESKTKYPLFYKTLTALTICLVLVLIGFTFRHFSSSNFYIENLLENTIGKGLLLLGGFVILLYSFFNWTDILLRYIAAGTFFSILFSMVSLVFIWVRHTFSSNHLFASSLFWYEVGLFCELLFFLMGLIYKNKKELIQHIIEKESLKKENDRQLLESQLAIATAQQITRNKIAADVHDELGAGMTHIRLMSELIKSKSHSDISKEVDKISNSATDLLKKISMLAWSINSKNDSLQKFIDYFQNYTTEYFEGINFKINFTVPEKIVDIELGGQLRRNLLLCIKEILNNIVKHSNATTIKISIFVNTHLIIKFIDDGIGFEMNPKNDLGNGLKNMEQRMKEIGGIISIESNGNGTALFLEIKL